MYEEAKLVRQDASTGGLAQAGDRVLPEASLTDVPRLIDEILSISDSVADPFRQGRVLNGRKRKELFELLFYL